jgi:hypothetical protein
MVAYTIPSGVLKWNWYNSNGFGLEGFNGAMGMGWRKWLSSSSVTPDRVRSVLIKLAATNQLGGLRYPNDTTASFAYRYLRNANAPPAKPAFVPYIVNRLAGLAYQDFQRSVPFAAYDVEATPPRRLAVGFLENNVESGQVDGKYWPHTGSQPPFNTDSTGAMEFFFIFDVPYDTTSNPTLQVDIASNRLPLMWWGTPTVYGTPFSSNDQFMIVAKRSIGPNDVWTFRPTLNQIIPTTFHLEQNYPNPFNGGTTIAYQVPVTGWMTLKVYNILAQEVKTLINEYLPAHYGTIRWDGTNNSGAFVSSGVYFYRLQAEGFVTSKKLILLR